MTWNTTSFSRTFATIALVFMIMTSTGLYGSVSFAASVDSLNLVGHLTNGGPSLVDNDRFGISVADINDLNVDGICDVAIGTHQDDTGGQDRDAIYVLFENANGTTSSAHKVASGTNGGPVLADGDRFGISVAGMGDLNGDAYYDIAVGAYQDDTGSPGVMNSTNAGALYVLFMEADGTVISSQKIASGLNGGPTLAAEDRFGQSVAMIGDVNKDGIQDLAVGAYQDDTGGQDRGSVYVLFMNANGSVASFAKIASGLNGGPALADGDRFGISVASIGDFDGDSVPDIASGAYQDDTGGPTRGAFYVLLLNADGTVKSSVKIASGLNGGPTLADVDEFGRGIALLDDLDENGVPDLAVSAYEDDTGGSNAGAVYLLHMNANGTVLSSVKLASDANGAPHLIMGDTFGRSVANIGDRNGDGISDLAVGSDGNDTGGENRGALYVLYLNVGTEEPIPGSSVKQIAHLQNGGPSLGDADFFGRSVAHMGDLNGDGVDDLAVSADFDDTGGSNAGAVYILFMKTDGTASSSTKIANNTNGGPALAAGDIFGRYVTNAGDRNGDGRADLAVGAYQDDTGGANRGAVYILFMNADGTASSFEKIASGLNGGPTLANGDEFGQSVLNVGDLNSDGVADLAVGAGRDETGGPDRGAVYILFMNADSSVASFKKIASDTNGGPSLSNGDFFGRSIADMGDLNSDGVSDLAVGAYQDDTGGHSRGAAYILFMNADSSVASFKKIASDTNGGPALADGDEFGQLVLNVGDLNSDGVADLAVGTPRDDTGGPDRGALYILFMNTDGTAALSKKIASGTSPMPELDDNDLLGFSAASLDDLNNDGKQDIAIAAIGDDTGGPQRGSVFVVFDYASQSGGNVNSTLLVQSTNMAGDLITGMSAVVRTTDGSTVLKEGYTPMTFTGEAGKEYRITVRNYDGRIFDHWEDGSTSMTRAFPLPSGNATITATYDPGDSLRGYTSLTYAGSEAQPDLTVNATRLGDNKELRIWTIIDPQESGNPTNSTTYKVIVHSFQDRIFDHWEDGSTSRTRTLEISADTTITAFYKPIDNEPEPEPPTPVNSFNMIGHLTNGGPSLVDNDRFGISVADINDLNVDGIRDIAVGAHQDDTGGQDRGAIYVLFTNQNGTASSAHKVASGTNGGPVLADGDRFGISTAGIGDLNGDAYYDIAVGAYQDDTGSSGGTNSTNAGALYVLFMEADGTVISNTKIASGLNGGPVLAAEDRFGQSVAMIGDLDGDGIQELAVGAYQDDTGGQDRGSVYVLFMNANGTVKSFLKVASGLNGGPNLADGDRFGISVTSIGDFNSDGVPDLAAGAYQDDTGGPTRGAFYVLLMNANGSIASSVKIASSLNGGPTLADVDEFGRSIALLSDIDNNDVPDLAVGAYEDDTGGSNAGSVYILHMNADGTVSSFDKIADETNGGPNLVEGDTFGRSVANIGDRNGDGVPDLAVGSDGNDTGGLQRGGVYVMHLSKAASPPAAPAGQTPSIEATTISLQYIGVLQLAAHDLYDVDRVNGTDSEDERLNLSTLFDHDEENIVKGGDSRNSDSIPLRTVAVNLGGYYAGLIGNGTSADDAKSRTLDRYHEQLQVAFKKTFGEEFPQATSEDLDKESNRLNGELALRTLHAFIPGEIVFNGEKVSIFDPSLMGKLLSPQELMQLSRPLDDSYDPATRNIPAGQTVIDLFERDSSFATQFGTDFTFEELLSDLADGRYDENDAAMKLIRADFAEGQNMS